MPASTESRLDAGARGVQFAVMLAGLLILWLRPPHTLVRLAARLLPDVVFYVRTNEPAVALTLDDGPDPVLTERVLDVLGRHGAQATFFLLGSRTEQHPGLVRRIVDGGHEVGNHGWFDEPSVGLAQERLVESLRRTDEVLASARPVRLFRPGSGWISRRTVALARQFGYRCVLGSVYPHDTRIRWRGYLVWDIARRARPGAVIVLHEGRPDRARVVAVLDEVLPRLRRRGLRVTTVTDLLSGCPVGRVPEP